MLTNKELLLHLERSIRDFVDPEGKVLFEKIHNIINDYMYDIDHKPKRVEKFIFVEDGSVDADELEERLAETNPESKVVVYRQGARAPELVEV